MDQQTNANQAQNREPHERDNGPKPGALNDTGKSAGHATGGHHSSANAAQPVIRHGEKKSIVDRIRQHPLLIEAVAALIILIIIGGFLAVQDMSGKIYIDKAQISAPTITLSPANYGVIEKFYVEPGDEVSQGQRVAQVGDQFVEAKTQGLIISIKNTPGGLSGPSDPLVQMIDPRQMRLVGKIQEDKGLADIKPGQRVLFTMDAFPGKQYEGVLESVGESALQNDIVFSISSQREERDFEVKVLYDTQKYPELKNGMSAKMWIYK